MKSIGMMSGTSLDGIDICLVDIVQQSESFEYTILAFQTYCYNKELIQKIQEASNLSTSNVQKICSLNVEVSEAYAEAISQFIQEYHINMEEVTYIAMHGQTIWHNPNHMDGYASSTLQIGDPSILAYRFNKMVISNFRTMDMAAGGSGAPLIPFVNYLLYQSKTKNVALQNIGGIGNVCYLRKNGTIDDVIAFDTGPGNMLIDAAMRKLYQLPFDNEGKIAKSGTIHQGILQELLGDAYFQEPYPKSTGREKYNDAYLNGIIDKMRALNQKNEDIIATITALTAYSIIDQYQRFLGPIDELIVSGGGAHNAFILDLLEQKLDIPIIVEERTDAYEAFGFAILGHMTILQKPSNIKSVTGAKHSVVLGNITYPPCKENIWK